MPTSRTDSPDELDLRIVDCLVNGLPNAAIAKVVKRPLSTVQRRVKHLIDSEIIKTKNEVNYKKFGFKKGLIHIYLNDGNAEELAQKVRNMKRVLSVSVHIGNSDVVAEYVCKDARDVLNLTTEIKHMPDVKQVVWSEQVYELLATEAPSFILDKPFKKTRNAKQG